MRRKFIYIVLFAITFSFAFLVGGPMPYFLFYVSILSILVPLVHLLISFLGIKAKINIPKISLFTGSEVDVEYSIRNRNFFSIPILKLSSDISKVLSDKVTDIRTLSLAAREDIQFKEKIFLKRRGFYENMDLNVTISDVFSIFSFKKKFQDKSYILVYPKVIELDSFRISSNKNLGEILVRDSIFEDKTSISNIKEYTEGDSINQIHWKVSAKRGSPMIKKFETVSNTNVKIFIDNNKSKFLYDADRRLEDKIVDTSIAIINYFLSLDIDVSLHTSLNDRLISISDKKKDEMKFYLELFARFKGNSKYNIIDLIEEKIHSFIDDSIIIIITPNLNKEIGTMGIKLKMKNLIPLFIVISDKENDNISLDKDVERRLTEENIDLYFIDYKSNVKEELELKHG